MRAIAVYCGSSPGNSPLYREAAEALGRAIAGRGLGLVYGGSRAGLMGVVADAALQAGGRVVGVIPDALVSREAAHLGLSELVVVESMHERKARMNALADAFIALPGGIGTLDEIVEMFTWSQLGIHRKPCALYNVAGYYEPLLVFLQRMAREGFLHRAQLDELLVADGAEDLLQRLAALPENPPRARVWRAPAP